MKSTNKPNSGKQVKVLNNDNRPGWGAEGNKGKVIVKGGARNDNPQSGGK